MCEFRIRLAVPEDVPVLLPLVEAYWRFENLPGFDALAVGDALHRVFDSPRLGSIWIAEGNRESEPLGYLVLVYVFSLEHGGLTAEIDELFVAEGTRGTGVGRMLLEYAEAECRRMGCHHLSLQIGSQNESARGFYRSFGFTPRNGFDLFEKMLN